MNRLLLEALSSAISAQASHTIPHLSGPVASLALHYGMDYAGDSAYKRIKKHPKLRRTYDKYLRSRNPKQRPGKFTADLASLAGTAAGAHLGGMVKGGKRKLLAQIAGGVTGHTVGRFFGNKAGNKLNHNLYIRRRKK